MHSALLNLYVLLTTPMPVPWTLLIKSAAVLLAFAIINPFETALGLSALNLAVVAGFLTVFSLNIPRLLATSPDMSPVALICAPLSLSAAVLFIPTIVLPFAISAGLFFLAAIYGVILIFDRPMIDRLGWKQDVWGAQGQTNVIRWTILRFVGLGVANAYAAKSFSVSEWIVCYAVLPMIFYAVFHWTIIATHPYEDQKTP